MSAKAEGAEKDRARIRQRIGRRRVLTCIEPWPSGGEGVYVARVYGRAGDGSAWLEAVVGGQLDYVLTVIGEVER
jgi:hypothetical protein